MTFTNVATLTGSTLNDGKPTFDAPDNPNERVYSVSDTSSVTVAGSGLVKSVDEPIRTIGQTATFVIATAIPPNTNFYGASIIDTVPAGFSAPANVTYDCVDIVTNLPVRQHRHTADAEPGSPTAARSSGSRSATSSRRPNIRREIITYTATVLDVPSNVAGVARTNTAQTAWFITPGHDPDQRRWRCSTAPGRATRPPSRSWSRGSASRKVVDDPTPDPGQPFTYTLTVTNAHRHVRERRLQHRRHRHGARRASSSSDATITNGGVLTGADPVTGGGTITWPASELAGPLAPGGTYVLTYRGAPRPVGDARHRARCATPPR